MGRTPKPSTPFAQRLITARGTASRAEIADALGCPVETLGNYERGRTFPDQSMLARIKAALGVSLDWLLTGEGGMRQDECPGEAGLYPLDEQLLLRIAEAIVTQLHEEGGEIEALQLVALSGSWYNDLQASCHSAEERGVGLRVMLQRLRRQWREGG